MSNRFRWSANGFDSVKREARGE